MRLSPDQLIFWQAGFVQLNATIVFTWVLMAVLALGSIVVTRRLSTGEERTAWQNLLEMLITGITQQIGEIGLSNPMKYLPFLGTLFLFVGASSLSSILPMFEPPTGSLSTTVALALCVFVAVPLYGIEARGPGAYLKSSVEPTFIMFPFNIISEVSRTLALAVRRALEGFVPDFAARETGHIITVSTGIATVSGLANTGFEELLVFPDGTSGIAFNLDETEIGVVLLGDHAHLQAGDEVVRTGRVMDVGVGDAACRQVH